MAAAGGGGAAGVIGLGEGGGAAGAAGFGAGAAGFTGERITMVLSKSSGAAAAVPA